MPPQPLVIARGRRLRVPQSDYRPGRSGERASGEEGRKEGPQDVDNGRGRQNLGSRNCPRSNLRGKGGMRDFLNLARFSRLL